MFVAGLLFVLGGCATLNSDADQALGVNVVLGEVLQASASPKSEQRAVLTRAQDAFDSDAKDINRLRLALLLAVLPEPERNDGRAAELLGALAGERSSTPAGRLAGLLSLQIAERFKSVEQERAAGRREEASKRQVELLKGQLDALKAIERSIVDRERRLPRNNNTR